MSTVLTIAADRSAMVDKANPTTNYSADAVSNLYGYKALLVGFPDTELQSYPFKAIEALRLQAYVQNNIPNLEVCAYGSPLLSDWTENAVTWETRPAADAMPVFRTGAFYSDGYKDFMDQRQTALLAKLLAYGALLSGSPTNYGSLYSISIQTSRGSNPPQLIVTLSDDDAVPTILGAPAGGYVNKHAANTLSWSSLVAQTVTPIAQTGATLRWREGGAGEVHEISNLGTATSYALAADSVSGSELQWQVALTYNSGATVTSPWYVCSTVEALSTAEIVSPKDTLVDGSAAIELKWRHVIATGTAQTAADLQTSADGTTWADLAQVSGSVSSYTVPAGTLVGGTLFWRVRTYNTDGAAGAWSNAAQISVVAGPGTPVVACTTAPRPLVSWQAAGQQGFEAEIGGQSSGVVYGAAKSWQPNEFLPDGQFTARVRVVNSYGLWSDWGEVGVTVDNPAANVPFQVTAIAGSDVFLSWDAVPNASFYRVYRDGALIGLTAEPQYVDLTSVGAAEYKVRALVFEGYCDSAAVSATVSPRCPLICALDRNWQTLRYTTEPVHSTQRTRQRAVALLSVQGSAFPVPEVSAFETHAYGVSVAFEDEADVRAFESLLGQVVVLKDQYGLTMTGVMASITTTSNRFFFTCAAQLQEIDGSAVGADELVGLMVAPPSKRYYGNLTSSLDLTGLRVLGAYANGDLRALPVDACEISPPDGSALTTAGRRTVTVSYGGRSAGFEISVMSGPVITEQPVDFVGKVDDTVVFHVVAQADTLTYQWKYRTKNGSTWNNSTLSGNKTATLSMSFTTARLQYVFRCDVKDGNDVTVSSDQVMLIAES